MESLFAFGVLLSAEGLHAVNAENIAANVTVAKNVHAKERNESFFIFTLFEKFKIF